MVKERLRMALLILQSLFYLENKTSRKVKLVLLFILLIVQMMVSYNILMPTAYMIGQSSNIKEFLGNMLAALVLSQVDNMPSIQLFYWLRTNYNQLTLKDNFMTVKSSAFSEKLQIAIYPLICLATLLLYL